MPITMTPDGPAIRAGGRLLKLVRMKDGTGVLTDDGPVLILDAIKAAFAVSEIVEDAHIEEVEDERTRFSFDTGPEVYEILTGWGAETENDEEGDPLEGDPDGEDDGRDLPKTLPPISSEPDDGDRPVFLPVPSSVLPAAVSARLAERRAAIAA